MHRGFRPDLVLVRTEGRSYLEPHPCTEERPFPHFQAGFVADTIFGPLRLGDDGRADTVQREAEGSEEEERGGGHPGEDGETERVSGTVDELLSKGFNRCGHVVVGMTSVRWEVEGGVGRKRSKVGAGEYL